MHHANEGLETMKMLGCGDLHVAKILYLLRPVAIITRNKSALSWYQANEGLETLKTLGCGNLHMARSSLDTLICASSRSNYY
jgi:hypothetical protein